MLLNGVFALIKIIWNLFLLFTELKHVRYSMNEYLTILIQTCVIIMMEANERFLTAVTRGWKTQLKKVSSKHLQYCTIDANIYIFLMYELICTQIWRVSVYAFPKQLGKGEWGTALDKGRKGYGEEVRLQSSREIPAGLWPSPHGFSISFLRVQSSLVAMWCIILSSQ